MDASIIPEGVEVVIVSKADMTALSKKYGKALGDKKFKLHEVISFPLEDGVGFVNPDGKRRLGSVVILEGLSEKKTKSLILHGVNHLFGRHHE